MKQIEINKTKRNQMKPMKSRHSRCALAQQASACSAKQNRGSDRNAVEMRRSRNKRSAISQRRIKISYSFLH